MRYYSLNNEVKDSKLNNAKTRLKHPLSQILQSLFLENIEKRF